MRNMMIKYNKRTLPFYIFIIFVLLLDYHCFYLFKYPQAMAQYFSGNYFHIIVSMIVLFLCSLILSKNSIKRKSGFEYLMKYSLLIYIGWFLITLYSAIKYSNQSLFQTISEGAFILIIPISVVFLYLFYTGGGPNKVFAVLNYFYIIWCVIIIVQQITYLKSGSLILDFDTYMGAEIRIRSYGLRLGLSTFGNMMLLYNFSKLIDNRERKTFGKKIIYASLVILGIYCVIFIQQTRMYMIADILAMVVIYLMSLGNKLTLKKLVLLLLLLIAFIAFTNSDSFENLLFSFSTSTNNETYASTAIRLDAIAYYIRCFLNNPIFGNGFARAEYYYYVEHGYRSGWYYFYSDTGLIGLIANMGLYGALIYLMPLGRMIKTSYASLKKNRTLEENLLIGITTWMIINSISLICIAKSGIIAFSFIVAFAEYVRACNLKESVIIK